MDAKTKVMKFGGTSLGDAVCIARAIDIVARACHHGPVVIVVSAMSGITNRLIEAACAAEREGETAINGLSEWLRTKHHAAVEFLIRNASRRTELLREIEEVIIETEIRFRGTALLGELTPRTLDVVCGAGERLAARVFAAALREAGINGVWIDATDVIVTNDRHGCAAPFMPETRERATRRLLPLLGAGRVPVVTGFIGATADGTPTTLGRGGSDYSATILGAALSATETIIWTDVDGVMTADPRLVAEARTLGEISYSEAAELAYFGANVIHPNTLRPVAESGIPIWIRNSFAPRRPGTKISPGSRVTGVKAITARKNVSLITVGGSGGLAEILSQTFAAAARVRAGVLLVTQSSSRNDVCFVVDGSDTDRTLASLRQAFANDHGNHVGYSKEVAVVTAVGCDIRRVPGVAARTLGALGNASINVLAIAQGSSEHSISLVVEASAMEKAVAAIHSEFNLQRAGVSRAKSQAVSQEV